MVAEGVLTVVLLMGLAVLLLGPTPASPGGTWTTPTLPTDSDGRMVHP